jgi:hypothetical protein
VPMVQEAVLRAHPTSEVGSRASSEAQPGAPRKHPPKASAAWWTSQKGLTSLAANISAIRSS